ncbi:MAG: hypothetical protein HZB37_01675 [Planctomycetes bacterium]|nr:hypothetical protein [Planctomycetota bacterium]
MWNQMVLPVELSGHGQIRLFTGFLATYFFALSYQHVKHNSDEITNMLTDRNGKCLYPEIKQIFDNHKNTNKHRNAGVIAFFHLLVGFVVITAYGYPLIPGRGRLCFLLDKSILISSLFLTFFFYWHVVLDMFKCRKLIKELINLKNKKHDYNYWHNVMKIIAKKTEAHAKIVKYPFILLLIICIARYNYFDNWRWTTPLAVIVTLSILIVLFASIMLFHEANVSRQKVVDRLNSDLLKLMGDKRKIYGQEGMHLKINIEFVKHIIEDIQNIKSGAFVPLSYNPILLSTLIPSGGMGIISLLQKFI